MSMKSIFDAKEVRSEFEKASINASFIPLIWKHVITHHQNPNNTNTNTNTITTAIDWCEIPSLPSAAYSLLASKFKPLTTTLHSLHRSSDGVTTKLLIKLQNGSFVEAVVMKYDTRLGKYDGKPRPGGPRSTLCVSSQVGCKMGCSFCATGSMGFKNNLSSGEIVEQLVHASRVDSIRNVVFMGMGEPLNNYAALVDAIRVMLGSPFQLSPRRITVSTEFTLRVDMINPSLEACNSYLRIEFIAGPQISVNVGIVHAINKLHNDLPGLNLAVSLHAPVQDIRCQIMPAARAFPLEKLMDALQQYQKISQQKILIEYIMLDGVNDGEQHAHLLGKLLETFQVIVNLIPFNPIGTLSQFRTSSEEGVSRFQKILRGTYNIRTTIRKQMGQDISGACGQLVVNLPDKKSIGNSSLLPDIEDLHL
ncbi:uncharacterized protein LOC115966244 isoform X1 [Quercus lobata]|uniref:Radical SAM core domain-containing protein n=1 Tax=Quercus lobata TaxID=97700 RepID=A0A7N2MX77_QUELO|nr:uncharacterized protein LOC115966244 isoform X1 [Quercus lobata]